MFGLRTKKPHPQAIRLQDLENPLAIVPLRAERVDSKKNDDGNLTLRIRLKPRNRIEAWTTRVLHMQRSAQINLDEVGTRYWQLIDGEMTLKQIAKGLSRHYRFSRNESREAVVLFTRRLLVRGFISIKLPGREQPWQAT